MSRVMATCTASGLGMIFGVFLWFCGWHHAGTVLLVAGVVIFAFSASRLAHIHYPDDASTINVYAVILGSLAGILFASLPRFQRTVAVIALPRAV